MRIMTMAVIGLAAFVAGCGEPDSEAAELTVDDVIDMHIAAIGGEEALEGLRNVRIGAEIVEPEFTIYGDYRAIRDGLMRVDIYADEARVFSEGIDADGAWQQGGTGAEITDVSDEGRLALERGVDYRFYGLRDLASRGHSAELTGREMIDGTNYYVVHVVRSDDHERYYLINPENWMIERVREVTALHPDIDPTEIEEETINSVFEEHCGVLMSRDSVTRNRETGAEIQRTTAQRVECNVESNTLEIARTADPERR